MKTLFTSDYAAITHILSYPIVIAGLLLSWPWLTNIGLVLWFTSFDVLMWKWVMHGGRTVLGLYPSRYSPDNIIEIWDFERMARVKNLKPDPEPILAYRIPQHGIFFFVLLLIGYNYGWQYSVPTFIVWITFGADVLYHWIAKAELPAWHRTDYYGYGYWSGQN